MDLAGILLGVRGTLSANLTSNDLDLGKRRPFQGMKSHFSLFSKSMLIIPMEIGETSLGVRDILPAKFTSNIIKFDFYFKCDLTLFKIYNFTFTFYYNI